MKYYIAGQYVKITLSGSKKLNGLSIESCLLYLQLNMTSLLKVLRITD